MRLRSLQLRNFRGFEELRLLFHDRLTVLVGINGSGKTTVLDALSSILRCYMPHEPPPSIAGDLRNGSPDVAVSLHFQHGGGDYRPQLAFGPTGSSGGRSANLLDPALVAAGKFPIACYFLVNRNAVDNTPGTTSPSTWGPEWAWEDAFSTGASFQRFFIWFREREDAENEIRRDDAEFRDSQLQAVRSAIERLLPGFSNVRVRRPRSSNGQVGPQLQKASLVVDKEGAGVLAFNQLSDGERILTAMVGDVARRLALANPHGDPLAGDGVVLIDEVELHLHPKWQVEVLGRLTNTFPNLQFVVTTHSPLVLSRVAVESVRLLEDFLLVEHVPHTRGRDTSAIVEDVFGVHVRPKDVRDKLEAIARLIDDEDLEGARTRLHALGEELGQEDAEVARLRAMIELLAS